MSSSERKVWQSPELLDKLLSYLDVSSTLHLAQAHAFTIQVLQNKSCWNKFIRRTCPSQDSGGRQSEAAVAELLKMMGSPQDLLRDLLDVVASRFPAEDHDWIWIVDDDDELEIVPCLVVVSCPCQLQSHSVFSPGFLHLELIEAALGSAEQRVEEVANDDMWIHFLINRLSRQQGPMAGTIHLLFCDATLYMLSSLTMKCQRMKITLGLTGTAEEWAKIKC